METDLVKIINEDCFNVFKNFEDNSVDLILTDPPYQINYQDGISLKRKAMIIENDKIGSINWEIFFAECYRILKNKKTLYMHCRTDMIMRIGKYILESKFKYCHDFVWLKGDMGYGNLNVMGTTHELIICLSKGSAEKSRVMTIDGKLKKRVPAFYKGKLRTTEYYNHPTQKPIELLSYIIENRTDKNDLVLDPFCGVGSTLLAAKQLQRRAIGIEISKNYYDLCLQRLSSGII